MSYQEQVTQDAFAQSGSTYGGSSPTSWASASGSGTATYNESDTFTPFSSGSSGSNGGSSSGSGWASAFSSWDNWSQSSYSASNTVQGKEWSASVSGSGPATLPSSPTASYGPSSQSAPGFYSSPYYTGANRYNLNNLGSPPSNSDGHLGPSTSYNGPMFEGAGLGGGLSLDSPLPVGDGQGVRAPGGRGRHHFHPRLRRQPHQPDRPRRQHHDLDVWRGTVPIFVRRKWDCPLPTA